MKVVRRRSSHDHGVDALGLAASARQQGAARPPVQRPAGHERATGAPAEPCQVGGVPAERMERGASKRAVERAGVRRPPARRRTRGSWPRSCSRPQRALDVGAQLALESTERDHRHLPALDGAIGQRRVDRLGQLLLGAELPAEGRDLVSRVEQVALEAGLELAGCVVDDVLAEPCADQDADAEREEYRGERSDVIARRVPHRPRNASGSTSDPEQNAQFQPEQRDQVLERRRRGDDDEMSASDAARNTDRRRPLVPRW